VLKDTLRASVRNSGAGASRTMSRKISAEPSGLTTGEGALKAITNDLTNRDIGQPKASLPDRLSSTAVQSAGAHAQGCRRAETSYAVPQISPRTRWKFAPSTFSITESGWLLRASCAAMIRMWSGPFKSGT